MADPNPRERLEYALKVGRLPLAQKYGVSLKWAPALQVQDQEEADKYFRILVVHTSATEPCAQETAKVIVEGTLGYLIGLMKDPVKKERLYKYYDVKDPFYSARL